MDKIKNYFENLKGKTVSLIGFGVSHRPVADMFLSHGVSGVVYDRKSEEQLRDIIKEYEGKNIRFVLGENYLDDDIVNGTIAFFRFIINPQDLLALARTMKIIINCKNPSNCYRIQEFSMIQIRLALFLKYNE